MTRHALRVLSLVISVGMTSELMAVSSQAVHHRTPEDFSKGELDALEVTETGILTLAPAYQRLATVPAPAIYSLAVTSLGAVLIGTGSEGRVYLLQPGKGQLEEVAKLPEALVTAVAVLPNGKMLAATSPDGKVYEIAPNAPPSVFVDPEARYLWQLLPEADGSLLISTGSPGTVLRIDPAGQSSTLLTTDETHVISLEAGTGSLRYAGTAHRGYLYELDVNKKSARVLLDAPGQELKAIEVAADGSLIALSVGTNTDPADDRHPLSGLLGEATQSEADSSELETRVYRLRPGIAPEPILVATSSVGHSLSMHQGRVLLGLGEEGKLLGISDEGRASLVADFSGEQVTAVAHSREDLILAVSNPSAVYQLSSKPSSSGRYASQVIDSSLFATWGRLEVKQLEGSQGEVSVKTRSGNTDHPDATWSEWVNLKETVASPPARYLQYELTLSSRRGELPKVREVTLNYRPANRRPQLESLQVQDPDIALLKKESYQSEPLPRGINVPLQPKEKVQIKKEIAQGTQSFQWEASDPDGDELRYEVFLRPADAASWRPLGQPLSDPFINFDATAFPDGWYQLRITASDAPSNLSEETLTTTQESVPFAIDHRGPDILQPEARLEGKNVRVRLSGVDATTFIKTGRYAIDGQPFHPIFPVDSVYDGPKERFDFLIPQLAAGPHSLVVTLEDAVGNVSTTLLQVELP